MAKNRTPRAAAKNWKWDRSRTVPAVKRILCVLMLVCAVIVSARTTWIVSETLFDSDTSSELILGEKLAREGGIMSPTWNYSTELQVIDCQIVYKLLFLVCSDWTLVRFWGAMLMQLMMLGAFAFLARQARIPFNRFCLAGAVMLLPFSVPYGRIVLYHNYYSFHMIMANLTVGLYFASLRRLEGEKPLKRWQFWICAAGLGLISFAAGLEGVRQMMVCTVPLLATALLSAMVGERGARPEEQNRLRPALPALLLALGTLAFSGLGYLVNTHAFGDYRFTDYSGQYVAYNGVVYLDQILRNFLSTIGYHEQTDLFTLHGILGMTGLLIWLVAVLLGLHTLRHTQDRYARFLNLFMLMTHLVMVCVFLFLALDGFRMDLYFLPVTFWILPALATADLRPEGGAEQAPGQPFFPSCLWAGDAKLSVHSLISLTVLGMFLANGLYYTAFFRNPSEYGSTIEYSGLNFNDTANVRGMTPIAEYLKENGYTLVYASYWDGAVITELTDGQVKSVPVQEGRRKHPITYYDWLSDLSLRDPAFAAEQKAAILANYDLTTALEDENKLGAVEIESFGGYTLFDLPDPASLANDLS